MIATACQDSERNDSAALIVEDGEKYPGNDGGVDRGDALGTGAARTAGGTNALESVDSTDIDDYRKTLGAQEDNPNFNRDHTLTGNDPVTPNAPLADGSAGTLKRTGVNAPENDGIVPASQSTGAQQGRVDVDADAPYGNNRASTGNRVDTEIGADRARVETYGGGDIQRYVAQLYGGAGEIEQTRSGDRFVISTYQPRITTVADASYTETKRKFAPVPQHQNYVTYAPITLKFTPILSWDTPAPAADEVDLAAQRARATPRLGDGCDNAVDVAACSSAAFGQTVNPILNDPRIARAVAESQVSGFTFEIDPRGRVLASSVVAQRDGRLCEDGTCARLQAVVAAALSQQVWAPAEYGGVPVATRVYVPLSVQAVREAG